MELKDIKKIIGLMTSNELSEFEMEDEGFRVCIKRGRGNDGPIMVSTPAASPMMMAGQAMPPMPGYGAPEAAPAVVPDEDEGLVDIASPMVGTFYRAGSPEADSFVSVGTHVDEDTVVCIIEAMKVMNEIKAETSGVIKKILVENATAVEFGQPLFKVEPV